jgi:toxin ParE1/3/4
MAHRVLPRATADLDDIWLYVAEQSGNPNIAQRLIDTITERFYVLSEHPYLGRSRSELRPALRSYPVRNFLIFYRVDEGDVVIIRILHGSRDVAAALRDDTSDAQ